MARARFLLSLQPLALLITLLLLVPILPPCKGPCGGSGAHRVTQDHLALQIFNFIAPAESLSLCQVALSQVLGIRTRTFWEAFSELSRD